MGRREFSRLGWQAPMSERPLPEGGARNEQAPHSTQPPGGLVNRSLVFCYLITQPFSLSQLNCSFDICNLKTIPRVNRATIAFSFACSTQLRHHFYVPILKLRSSQCLLTPTVDHFGFSLLQSPSTTHSLSHLHAQGEARTCTHIQKPTCTHIYTQTHTYTHNCIHTTTHMQTRASTQTCIHNHTHMQTHTHTHTYIHTYRHTHTCIHTCTHTGTCIHIYTQARTCINTHTDTNIHTGAHRHKAFHLGIFLFCCIHASNAFRKRGVAARGRRMTSS